MERSIEVQAQIRRDAEDQCRALRELQEWEEEMKRRGEEDRRQQEQLEQEQRQKDTTSSDDTSAKVEAQIDNPPPGLTTRPVRSTTGGVGGVRANVNGTAMTASTTAIATTTTTSISNHGQDANQESPEEETRQRGNDLYAASKYDDAIKCYTACLRYDPRSAVVYSNRAMAHLKKKDWLKAEDDASMALTIDPSHVKSYQRRSVARASLGKLRAALLDLSRAEAELGSLDSSSGGSVGGMLKSLAAERKRVESLLRAAMKRAPRRCNVPIVMVVEETKEEETTEELTDDAVSKASSDENAPASDVSRESDGWVVVDTSVSGGNDEPTQQINTSPSSAAKLMPRKYKKPTTWYEFETTWRSLDSLEERGVYLSSIKPKWLAVLYRNGMEDVEIVVDIVVAAGTLMTMDANSASLAKEYVQCVTNTKSIDIPVMMMNGGQRKEVQNVIEKIFLGDDDDADEKARKAAVKAKLGC